jgi:hypothetical protein
VGAARHGADAAARAGRVEARSDHHREDELVLAVGVAERVEVRELDVDRLPRLDVCDRLREDVRPLLREERRGVSLALRLGVDALGVGAFPDDAPDVALADRHHELAHGGVLGEREDVDRLDLLGERDHVGLTDADRLDVSRDGGVDVRVAQRKRHVVGAAARAQAGGRRRCRRFARERVR